MRTEDKYETLKNAALLMALDTGGNIAQTILFFVAASLGIANNYGALFPMAAADSANVYILYMLWVLRGLIWMLTIGLLSHMAILHRSFGKAGIWYLLRILAFIMTTLVMPGVAYAYLHNETVLQVQTPSFIMIVPIFELDFLLEAFLLSMGNRAVLATGAELLETFGMKKAAEKNRLCGNCLTGFAAAYVILVVFTCTLLLEASLTNALPLSNTLETGDIWKFLLWPEKVSFMLCLFAWLGMEAFRIFASACMKRVYRIIQELIT